MKNERKWSVEVWHPAYPRQIRLMPDGDGAIRIRQGLVIVPSADDPIGRGTLKAINSVGVEAHPVLYRESEGSQLRRAWIVCVSEDALPDDLKAKVLR
jgi:hypothetical protein